MEMFVVGFGAATIFWGWLHGRDWRYFIEQEQKHIDWLRNHIEEHHSDESDADWWKRGE